MTDRFGPGHPCSECGGDYGAHTDTCPMTTPHAPEGGEEAMAVDAILAAHSGPKRVAAIERLLTAARKEGATAERARLAGLASEEDREMVDALDSICRSGRVMYLEWLEAYTTLLARLAAARGEDAPPSDAQSARQPGDPCDCGAMWAERDRLRTALAAAERAGAEKALRWALENRPIYWRDFERQSEERWVNHALAALFPPPGAEVGHG